MECKSCKELFECGTVQSLMKHENRQSFKEKLSGETDCKDYSKFEGDLRVRYKRIMEISTERRKFFKQSKNKV